MQSYPFRPSSGSGSNDHRNEPGKISKEHSDHGRLGSETNIYTTTNTASPSSSSSSPPQQENSSRTPHSAPCKFFKSRRGCQYGDRCWFKHSPPGSGEALEILVALSLVPTRQSSPQLPTALPPRIGPGMGEVRSWDEEVEEEGKGKEGENEEGVPLPQLPTVEINIDGAVPTGSISSGHVEEEMDGESESVRDGMEESMTWGHGEEAGASRAWGSKNVLKTSSSLEIARSVK